MITTEALTPEEHAGLLLHFAAGALNADNATDALASAPFLTQFLRIENGHAVVNDGRDENGNAIAQPSREARGDCIIVDEHGAPRIKADLINCHDRPWTMQELLVSTRYYYPAWHYKRPQ